MKFRGELSALLKRWGTEIEIEYGIVDSTETMKAYLNSVYEDDELIAEYTEVDLGTSFSGR